MNPACLTFTPPSRSRSSIVGRQDPPLLVAPTRRLGWWQRLRTRRQLARLDIEQLADIGVTRREALAEAGKLPWR